MSGIQSKIMRNTQKKLRRTPAHFQEIKHLTKPEWEVTQRLEPSDRDFRLTMINLLKELVQKVGSVCEQMETFSRDGNDTRANRNVENKNHDIINEEFL